MQSLRSALFLVLLCQASLGFAQSSSTATGPLTSAEFERISKGYTDQRQKTAQELLSEKRSQALILGSIDAASSVAGPLTGVPGGFLYEYTSAGLSAVLDHMRDQGVAVASDYLASQLKDSNLSTDLASRLNELNKMKGEDRARKALELARGYEDAFFSGIQTLDQDDQVLARGHYNAMMADALVQMAAKSQEERLVLETKVDDLGSTMVALSFTFDRYIQRNGSLLEAMGKQQELLADNLLAVNDRLSGVELKTDLIAHDVNDLRTDVGFLTGFAYSRMSPQEQRDALEKGMFDLTGEERIARIEKLNVVIARIEFQKTAAMWLDGAGQVLAAADGVCSTLDICVDPNILETANDVVNISNAGMMAFDLVVDATNPLGYFKVAGILFNAFNKKPDADQQRFEAIMGRLDQIDIKLDVIIENQKKLFDNQKRILEGQRVIYKRLEDLAEDMSRNFERVFDALEDIKLNQDRMLERLNQLAQANLHACVNPRGVAQINENMRQAAADGVITTAAQLHAIKFEMDLSTCLNGALESYFTGWEEGQLIYSTRNQEGVGQNFDVFNGLFYSPVRSVLMQQNTISRNHLDSLAAPVFLLDEIDHVLPVTDLGQSLETLYNITDLNTFPEHFLAIDQLDRRVEELHWLYPLYEYVRGENASLLRNVVHWLNLAIAQENLLAGGVILPRLYTALQGIQSSTMDPYILATLATYKQGCGQWGSKEEQVQMGLCMLATNALLARNYIVYALRKEFSSDQTSLLNYSIALAQQGQDINSRLEGLLPSSWHPHWYDEPQSYILNGQSLQTPKGWAINLGGRYYPLPSADQVHAGEMAFRDQMNRLVEWKEIYISRIAEIRWRTDLSPSDRERFMARLNPLPSTYLCEVPGVNIELLDKCPGSNAKD